MSGLMFSLCAVLLAVPTPPEPMDAKLLQGEWRVVDADCDIRDLAKRWMGSIGIVRGNSIHWRHRDMAPAEGTFVLDPAKMPKAIDFYSKEARDPTVPCKGIYAVEKDRLRLYWRIDGQPRPTTFELSRDDRDREYLWLILERLPKK